jgi:hypothetical protein
MAATLPALLRRLLACSALGLAFVPATAHAEGLLPDVPVPAAAPLMATGQSLAAARWGVDPCGGQVAVSWSHMGPGINARSQWMSVDINDASSYTECAITYNLDVDWDWPKLCTVIEHELGHLAGRQHVNDPRDVMSAYYIYPAPECAPKAPAAPAPRAEAAPRKGTSATSSRRATSKKAARKHKAAAKRMVAKRKAAQRKAKGSAKGRSARTRKARRAKGRTAGVALAFDSRIPQGLFGCMLVDAR